MEYETVMRQVQQCVCGQDACGCPCPQVAICEVPCQVARQVPYEVEQEFQVLICDWEEKEYTVKVAYQDWEDFTCQQRYCEMEAYQQEVQCCPVCRCARCCCP
jgi:hypothetical protein